MIPLLLRPKWLALRNSAKQLSRSPQQVVRTVVLLGFALLVMWAIFTGTEILLSKIREQRDIVYFSASVPLGLLLVFILAMLFLSALVSAIGTLFHAHDLDLIMASSLSAPRFFFGKFMEVLISSSWLVIIFGVPAIAAFASVYGASWSYPFAVALALVPYFFIPVSIAFIVATIFASALPGSRTREIYGIISIVTFIGLFMLFRLILPSSESFRDVNAMLRLFSVLLIPNAPWTPSYWASSALGEILDPAGRPVLPYFVLLYAVAVFWTSAAYLTFRFRHFAAYSKVRLNRIGRSARRALIPHLIERLPVPPALSALITKEFRIFTRDITQAMQLLLLLGICVIYLYNLRLLHSVQGLAEAARMWWEAFLLMTNICLGAFVISAMCTRFVFPSVSLEGQSFWILLTSPVSLERILRAKFWAWLIPVSLVSTVTFAAGALAINAAPFIVVLNIVTSWVISFGIVGIAIGLGAYFANFDWEHPGQLAASFGSLVFMLVSVFAIFLNMLPPALLIFLRSQQEYVTGISQIEWYFAVGSTLVLLVYINITIQRWALTVGTNALHARQE